MPRNKHLIGIAACSTVAIALSWLIAGAQATAPLPGGIGRNEETGDSLVSSAEKASRQALGADVHAEAPKPTTAQDLSIHLPWRENSKASAKLVDKNTNREIRTFYFKLDAWDSRRILASKVFNPRQVDCVGDKGRILDAFVAAARQKLGSPIRGMTQAASNELRELAQAGKARMGPPLVITKGSDPNISEYTLSMRRGKNADLQYGTGDGMTYVANWHELRATRQLRSTLALGICDNLCRLAALLESHSLLNGQEVADIIYAAIDIAARYQT